MLCFRKIPVAKKLMEKKEGEVSRFLSNFFCLTVSKNAVVEPFSLSLISGIEKTRMRGWGGSIKTFRQYCVFSECLKIFVG